MVALREMRERFRGRAFKISTVIAAAVVAGIIIVPNLNKDEDTVYDVGLVNVTNPVVKQAVNAVGPAIGATLRIHDVASVAEATRQVRLKTLDIALVEGNRIIVSEKADPGRISKKLRLQLGISEASRLPTALTAEGLSPEQVARALTRPPLEVDALSRPKVANESVATGIIGVIALFIFLQQYGGWILVGVAEEKSSRIAEVLLAAVRPRELVAGKIVGIGIIGLAQASTVAATAVIASRVVGSDALAGTSAFYALGAVGWFVLGFLFYGWAFAAAGSLVSRQSEAQSAAFPIFIPMFAGYLAATTSFGTTDPNAIVRFLAYFPPTAPLCMPVLMADGVVAGWQIALAAGGVVLSVLLIARVAGAVYANSILRTGKRVKWMEALRSA
jgi:ABC-2 type transport system permease protein